MDAEEIARVHVAAWQWAYGGIFPADALARLDVSKRADGWRRILGEGKSTTLVAEVKDQVAGFIDAGRTRDEDRDGPLIGEVYAVYVHPSHSRAGIGGCLLTAAESALATQGLHAVTLWVLTENAIGRGFYDSHGYMLDGIRKEAMVLGTVVEELRYRRGIALERITEGD